MTLVYVIVEEQIFLLSPAHMNTMDAAHKNGKKTEKSKFNGNEIEHMLIINAFTILSLSIRNVNKWFC